MNNAWFITGTDTEVGKTYVSSLILQTLNAHQHQTVGYKPIASGAEATEMGFKNPDAVAHLKASNPDVTLTYDEVNPYFFEIATAPHLLSRAENRPIEFKVMTQGAEHLLTKSHYLLVEGAGGWFTPLNEEGTFADWVIKNRFPVVVVVGLKLGCINHALLTFEAVKQAGLPILGWVGNHIHDGDDCYIHDYMESIRELTDIPCLGEVKHGAEFRETNLNIAPLIEYYSL